MNAKCIYTIDKLPLDTTNWKRIAKLSDKKVEAQAKADPDAQPLSKEHLKKFKRVHPPEELDVSAIRKKLGLSQTAFAAYFGINKRTIQEWEQGRRHPVGAARVLLTIISHEPKAVQRALLISHHSI